MREIADEAGVSLSTVSLALRGDRRVRPELQCRIRAIADELGYRPDPAFSELAATRWRHRRSMRGLVLALILHRQTNRLPSPQQGFIEPLRNTVTARGYNLDVFDMEEYRSASRLQKVLCNRGIRGLILPAIPTLTHLEALDLDFDKFTTVSMGVGRTVTPFHTIGHNIFRNTRRVIEEAWQRGYDRIGVAPFSHTPLAREDAYRIGSALYLREVLGADATIPVLTSPRREDDLLEWFHTHQPQAVITHTAKAYWLLKEQGIQIPEKTGFAALNIAHTSSISGSIVEIQVVADAAVDFVLAQIRQNAWGIPLHRQVIQVDGVWNEGSTLPWRIEQPRPLPEIIEG